MTVQRYDDGMSMFGFIDKEVSGRFVLHRDYVVAVRAMAWWRNRCRAHNERMETLSRACAGHLEQAERATKAEAKLAQYKTTYATSLRINEENNNLRAELSQAYDERNVTKAKLTAAEEALREFFDALDRPQPMNQHDFNMAVTRHFERCRAILAGHAPATPQYMPLEPEPWGGSDE